MKILFAGTPEFAATHLQALLDKAFDVCAVFTQPDRPAGRGRKLSASPVKTLALQHHLPIHQPEKLDHVAQHIIENYQADLMVVVAYGLLIPKTALNIPKQGFINVHASLLPRWRGAAPIQRAILAGDKETGVTIMQIDEGLDSGDMLLKASCHITDEDTSASLHDKLATLGTNTLIDALKKFETLTPEKQNENLVTYAKKIKKSESVIDWQQSAKHIHQQIRAFNPWPVAQTQLGDTILRIWLANFVDKKTSQLPGTILEINQHGIQVATGDGILQLTTIQFPGKKPLSIANLLNAKANWFEQHQGFH